MTWSSNFVDCIATITTKDYGLGKECFHWISKSNQINVSADHTLIRQYYRYFWRWKIDKRIDWEKEFRLKSLGRMNIIALIIPSPIGQNTLIFKFMRSVRTPPGAFELRKKNRWVKNTTKQFDQILSISNTEKSAAIFPQSILISYIASPFRVHFGLQMTPLFIECPQCPPDEVQMITLK